MLIPRDVWELVATVPLPKILKNCSPSTTRPPATSEAPLKSSEPSSLLQQSSGILQKSSSEVCALFQQSSAIIHKSSTVTLNLYLCSSLFNLNRAPCYSSEVFIWVWGCSFSDKSHVNAKCDTKKITKNNLGCPFWDKSWRLDCWSTLGAGT